MTKPMTIKSPSKAWAAVNPNGDVWHIDTMRRTKQQFTGVHFFGKYETDFKPHGWKIVRVQITPMKGKR